MQGNPPPFLLLATAVAQIAPKSGVQPGLPCLTFPSLETAHTGLHNGPHRRVFHSLVHDRQRKFFLALIFEYSDPSAEVPDAREKDFSAHILTASVYEITDSDLTLALSR